jgi:hypothetical protein
MCRRTRHADADAPRIFPAAPACKGRFLPVAEERGLRANDDEDVKQKYPWHASLPGVFLSTYTTHCLTAYNTCYDVQQFHAATI